MHDVSDTNSLFTNHENTAERGKSLEHVHLNGALSIMIYL